MNEKENISFRFVFEFYDKWRSVIIETDQQWKEFADDLARLSVDIDFQNNVLGRHLMTAVFDTFNDLYRNGNKPVPTGYFGRDDM